MQPELIEHEVKQAMSYLLLNENPIENAVRFYQHFVFTHPFYDANGRIARLISNLYLANNDLTIHWHNVDVKKSFLSKLNWYHKSKSEEALKLLIKQVKESVSSIKSIED